MPDVKRVFSPQQKATSNVFVLFCRTKKLTHAVADSHAIVPLYDECTIEAINSKTALVKPRGPRAPPHNEQPSSGSQNRQRIPGCRAPTRHGGAPPPLPYPFRFPVAPISSLNTHHLLFIPCYRQWDQMVCGPRKSVTKCSWPSVPFHRSATRGARPLLPGSRYKPFFSHPHLSSSLPTRGRTSCRHCRSRDFAGLELDTTRRRRFQPPAPSSSANPWLSPVSGGSGGLIRRPIR